MNRNVFAPVLVVAAIAVPMMVVTQTHTAFGSDTGAVPAQQQLPGTPGAPSSSPSPTPTPTPTPAPTPTPSPSPSPTPYPSPSPSPTGTHS